MIQTIRPPQNTRREITDVASVDGARLALHVWRPEQPKGAVFYFHGLQSHAGWLWEVGPRFADNDIAFFVLDRRGSGISPGSRDDLADTDTLLSDYIRAVAAVRESVGEDVPLTLFGHCLGGSFLAALLCDRRFTSRYDSAVFCSSWLGRLHATLGDGERAELAASRSTERWDAGLRASDFTDDIRYRHFIDHDDLAVTGLTARSRAVLLELERRYLQGEGPTREVPAPTFVSGTTDPVVDLNAARGVFQELVSGRGTEVRFPTDKHYLFYTGVSDDLVDWTSTHTLLRAVNRGA